MGFGYPVSLELTGRRAVVVGAGAVAQGKVEGLLAAGADVVVVAEGPKGILDRLEAEGHVKILRRAFRSADLDGAFLCVSASEDPDERAEIYAAGRRRGVLVNVMDDIPHCDFAAPAIVRRGDLLLAVSTGGRSPALARRLRIELEERFGPEWEEIVALVGEVREETIAALPDLADRAKRWEAALDTDEVAGLVRAGRSAEARERLRLRLVPEGGS
jgi:siroheme synthase-like protein